MICDDWYQMCFERVSMFFCQFLGNPRLEIRLQFSGYLLIRRGHIVRTSVRRGLARGWGTHYKWVTGMCGHIDLHFSTPSHPTQWPPFLFNWTPSHPMTPFLFSCHQKTPFFSRIFAKFLIISHQMTPFFHYFSSKFFKKCQFWWLFENFVSTFIFGPKNVLSLTERPLFGVNALTERPLVSNCCPHIPVTSKVECSPSPMGSSYLLQWICKFIQDLYELYWLISLIFLYQSINHGWGII